MNRKNKIYRIISAFLILLFLTQTAATVQAETGEQSDSSAKTETQADEEDGTIYISSAEDFLELAEQCSLDTWSKDKKVVLKEDISLDETDVLPIPTFGGTFDGGGHTISGLSVTGSVMPAGLFGILQEGAVVKNLNVNGYVSPSGDAQIVGGIVGENNGLLENCSYTGSVSGDQNVGGIAGINGNTGTISACRASGDISGEDMTGGIAGYNLGKIVSCQNDASVNVESVDPAIHPEDINLDFMTDISRLYTLDTSMAATDTGGIAGYSSGIVSKCVNSGRTGYPHIGYNVGGIVGRSCGFIDSCTNQADIYGRKDVGGIAGQMEPYINMELTEDTLSRLQEQMDELSTMINRTLDDADASVGTLTSRLSTMANYLDAAAGAAQNIRTTGSVNSIVEGSGQTSGSGSVTFDPPEVEVSEGESGGADTESGGESSEGSGNDAGEEDGGEGGNGVSPPPEDIGDAAPDLSESEIQIGLGTGSVEASNTGTASGTVKSSTQIRMNTSLYQLSAAISGLSGQMRMLGGEAGGASGTMTSDMKAINSQVDAIADTFFGALFGGSDNILNDTSEANIDAVTYGKVISGQNSGEINGDINVGGIAGMMAIEYELDPEDDITSGSTGGNRRELELKAIIQKCVNTGEVVSKRNYTGSVCGHLSIGLITQCEGYGDVKSENGDYVGGIVGLAGGNVRNCYVKCTLKGGKYIGGIAGSGISEDVDGTASSITDCCALVSVEEYEQYVGGIAGSDAGEFSNNYYVSDGIAAINRLSYSGKAEPIEYEDLLNKEGIPEEFRHLTLRFIAEDEILKTVTFDYGDSLDEEVYPDIPEKDGYYSQWDIKELNNLRFDTDVTAVYSAYNQALTDSQVRKDGRSVFFVEGQFEDGDKVTIREQSRDSADLGVTSESIEEALRSYFSFVEKRTLPDTVISKAVVEHWNLTVPEDGLSEHSVRYLAPNGKTDNLDVYVKEDGTWNKVETEPVGSYLTFSVPASKAGVELAVVSTMQVWWIWLVFFGLVFGIIFLIVRGILRIRRRIRKAEEELQKARADILILKTGRVNLDADPPAAEIPGPEPEQPDNGPEEEGDAQAVPKKKKKKRWLIPLVILFILLMLAVAAVFVLFKSGIMSGREACRLLQDYMDQTEVSMELNVQADIGQEDLDTLIRITRTESDGHEITCVEQSGITLYYCDETVYLENGKAFRINDMFPDYSDLLKRSYTLYQSIDISSKEGSNGKIYSITAEGEDAKTLLEILVPSVADKLSDAQVIRVELEERDQKLSDIRFSANGTLSDDNKTKITLEAELTDCEFDEDAARIPAKVQDAVEDGKPEKSSGITEDLFRLLAAWSELEQRDIFSSTLQLAADCGPLTINDSMQLFGTEAEEQEIYCIRKDGRSVYFTDHAVCNQDGSLAAREDKALVESARLLEIAYQACLNGHMSCTESDGAYIYTLKLDQEGMETVAYTIAPEAEDMDISFQSGSIQITLQKECIRSIHFGCSGSVDVASISVPVSLSGDILVDDAGTDRDFTVPEAVIRKLKDA